MKTKNIEVLEELQDNIQELAETVDEVLDDIKAEVEPVLELPAEAVAVNERMCTCGAIITLNHFGEVKCSCGVKHIV